MKVTVLVLVKVIDGLPFVETACEQFSELKDLCQWNENPASHKRRKETEESIFCGKRTRIKAVVKLQDDIILLIF